MHWGVSPALGKPPRQSLLFEKKDYGVLGNNQENTPRNHRFYVFRMK